MIKYFTFSPIEPEDNKYVGGFSDLDSEFFDTTSLDGKHSSHEQFIGCIVLR